jgi:hypothetical protein
MMKILSVRQYNDSLKVTVQQTGKLNFNAETGEALELTLDKGVKFFIDGEPEQLYMAIMAKPDKDAFPLRKSGAYFYVAAKLLFDDLGVDYKTYTVFYDLVRCASYDEEAGGVCYKMNLRTIKKKSNDEDLAE